MINKVMLLGRLGVDPEVKEVNDSHVCNFSLATNKVWKDKNGERQEATEWHRIVIWGKLAEICGEHLAKGSTVFLEGEIHTRKWQDKEGTDRYTTEISAYTVQFIGPKPGDKPESENDVPF